MLVAFWASTRLQPGNAERAWNGLLLLLVVGLVVALAHLAWRAARSRRRDAGPRSTRF